MVLVVVGDVWANCDNKFARLAHLRVFEIKNGRAEGGAVGSRSGLASSKFCASLGSKRDSAGDLVWRSFLEIGRFRRCDADQTEQREIHESGMDRTSRCKTSAIRSSANIAKQ